MKKVVCLLMLALVWCGSVLAQSSRDGSAQDSQEDLRKYVPLLPSVKANRWKLDPAVGYAVKSMGGGVYVISDNGWQSAFLVTDEGVVVFDAPASFGKNIPSAIAKITDKPIKMLVYSHVHKDHIGGSAALKNIPGLQIIALEGVSDFLKGMNDPDRLVPTATFKSEKILKLGGRTVELTAHHYHSAEGDLFIYIPHARFMMAVDSVTAGYAPFQGFDLTENFDEYLKMFDELLAYDFDNFCGGHLTDTGTKKDVEITKEYTYDVYKTVKRIHNNLDQAAVTAQAARTVGTDNEFLLFKVVLDKVARGSVAELQPRWINRLAGVDVWLESHVRTALIYVRWDDKL
jgi:glyoxylase-like metal-dependent hydrolase (beta-lactamase superfamily II)